MILDHWLVLAPEPKQKGINLVSHVLVQIVPVRANYIIVLEAIMPTKEHNNLFYSQNCTDLVRNFIFERGRVALLACISFGAP